MINCVVEIKAERNDVMKKNIEVGFYKHQASDSLFQITKNTDKNWLREEPEAVYLREEWLSTKKENIYESSGNIIPINVINTGIFKQINILDYKISGDNGEFLQIMCPNDTNIRQ